MNSVKVKQDLPASKNVLWIAEQLFGCRDWMLQCRKQTGHFEAISPEYHAKAVPLCLCWELSLHAVADLSVITQASLHMAAFTVSLAHAQVLTHRGIFL